MANTNVNDPSYKALVAQIAELQAEIAQRKSVGVRQLSFKVSEKGAVSVYGLGRFPVTLYREQMIRLLDSSEGIKTFIKDNDSALKVKGDKVAATPGLKAVG